MDRRSLYGSLLLAAGIGLCLLLFGRAPASASTSGRTPLDPSEVLETLPIAVQGGPHREVRGLRRALADNPRDLPRALRLARLDIGLARERSDPRYLGHAQAALAPWWGLEAAPVPVLVLRATIEQSLHDFDAALEDLDRAVAADPAHVQAWLTRAVVLSVRGRYDEARASCARIAALTSELVLTVCTTAIDSVTGHAAAAHDALASVVAGGTGPLSPEERAWALSSLAEYALRAGNLDQAEGHFRETLTLDPEDSYARAALSDLLLDRGRPEDALAVVRGREINDTLLLRIAIAERRAGLPEAAAHGELLRARFAASKLRGDVVHRREESRFVLELSNDPGRALELAVANWDVQKEPADVRVYLEAARAAKRPEAARGVLAWIAETKLEDPFIARVAADLRAGEGP
ncbi:MAG: hypothetical protein JWP97_3822 [Labilithrix sp.]|nr:hypothetical protein [Labilithrix sp.]